MTKTKVFEQDGYWKIDPETGEVRILDADGKVHHLTPPKTLNNVYYGTIKLYELGVNETQTAQQLFSKGQRGS